jgi:hypothetical protein
MLTSRRLLPRCTVQERFKKVKEPLLQGGEMLGPTKTTLDSLRVLHKFLISEMAEPGMALDLLEPLLYICYPKSKMASFSDLSPLH